MWRGKYSPTLLSQIDKTLREAITGSHFLLLGDLSGL